MLKITIGICDVAKGMYLQNLNKNLLGHVYTPDIIDQSKVEIEHSIIYSVMH